MFDYSRKISEIIAMAKLEPSLKSIYVEGLSDYYVINNFLDYFKKRGIGVYLIDDIDFSEKYQGLTKEEVSFYQKSNKERVILLAMSLEDVIQEPNVQILCLVDRDWDFVTGNVRSGKFMVYTDFNSMELYLFNFETVDRFLKQGHRIAKAKTGELMDSLSEVCRESFHIHCLANDEYESMVSNDKDFMFDKSSYTCTLNLDSFWTKTMMKCKMMDKSDELKSIFSNRMAVECDVRLEMRGHDFIHYLYLCVKKLKSALHMDENEFANVFWQYLNMDTIVNEPLFQRIMAM